MTRARSARVIVASSSLQADRAAHAGRVVGAVAVGVLRQVLLVVILGVEELRRFADLRGDLVVACGTQAVLVRIAARARRLLLKLAVGVDRASVLRPDV